MTIGEKIQEKIQEGYELYQSVKKNPISGVEPSTIATHDIRIEHYIAGRVLEGLEAKIKEDEERRRV